MEAAATAVAAVTILHHKMVADMAVDTAVAITHLNLPRIMAADTAAVTTHHLLLHQIHTIHQRHHLLQTLTTHQLQVMDSV